MAVFFKTNNPAGLLSAFKKAIDQGHVKTWAYDGDGDFTHTAEQWKNCAWLRPQINHDSLEMFIIKPNNSNVSYEVYGVYHGRFIESMIVHCNQLFSTASATATAAGKDNP